jgi:protoheme ferro-lyase
VLPLRSRASAKKYQSVWLVDGSPLRVYTEHQAYALKSWFRERGEDILVEYAMRYGSPSIADAFALLQGKGREADHSYAHVSAVCCINDSDGVRRRCPGTSGDSQSTGDPARQAIL